MDKFFETRKLIQTYLAGVDYVIYVCHRHKQHNMKYIEIKSEGYTYRYDFESTPSLSETFNPNIVIPIEPRSSALESLTICIDFLSAIFGKEETIKALEKFEM